MTGSYRLSKFCSPLVKRGYHDTTSICIAKRERLKQEEERGGGQVDEMGVHTVTIMASWPVDANSFERGWCVCVCVGGGRLCTQ